jgi:hypothetical protein
MYLYVLFCDSVLTYQAVMCIFVIFKCLSWGSNQRQNLGKPSQEKIAKPSYRWEGGKRFIPCGE